MRFARFNKSFKKQSLNVSRSLVRVGIFGAAAAAFGVSQREKQAALNCGIVGYIGSDCAVPYLLEGITILQNRGYDSAGIATLTPAGTSDAPSLSVTKYASAGSTSDCVELLEQRVLKSLDESDHRSIRAPEPSVPSLSQHTRRDNIGIGHTRWATHGGKTDANAHPHLDAKGRVALIHNGTIANSGQLRFELQEKGIVFQSQTDTEVIVQMIGVCLDQGSDLMEAISKTLARLEGTWGLVIISKLLPDTIIATRNGSPLVIGLELAPSSSSTSQTYSRVFVASEVSAFSRHTTSFVALQDGETARISLGHLSLSETEWSSRIETAPTEHIELSSAPFPHWTLKEIHEQPEAFSRCLNYGGRFFIDSHDPESTTGTGSLRGKPPSSPVSVGRVPSSPNGPNMRKKSFSVSASPSMRARLMPSPDLDTKVKLGGLDGNQDNLLGITDLVISACGTSLYAGMYGAGLFRHLHCFSTVSVVDAAELNTGYFPFLDIGGNEQIDSPSMVRNGCAGLLVISQSGETKDVTRAIQVAKNLDVPTFSIVNVVGSVIARMTSCGVYLNAGREHAVASTKAFVTQVTALGLIASWFAQARPWCHRVSAQRLELNRSLSALPVHAATCLTLRAACQALAKEIYKSQSMFVLGKGFGESIAREAALKIKEITYIHAEGYSGGALKHGPFALLEEGTPVIHIVLDDEHADMMRIAAEETKARGAFNIVVTDRSRLAAHLTTTPAHVLVVPHNGVLSGVLAMIPLQLLAYELSVLKGINPDKPKNLAKAVTTD